MEKMKRAFNCRLFGVKILKSVKVRAKTVKFVEIFNAHVDRKNEKSPKCGSQIINPQLFLLVKNVLYNVTERLF
jgi:hypothetical protein